MVLLIDKENYLSSLIQKEEGTTAENQQLNLINHNKLKKNLDTINHNDLRKINLFFEKPLIKEKSKELLEINRKINLEQKEKEYFEITKRVRYANKSFIREDVRNLKNEIKNVNNLIYSILNIGLSIFGVVYAVFFISSGYSVEVKTFVALFLSLLVGGAESYFFFRDLES